MKIALISLNQFWEDKLENQQKVLQSLCLLENYSVDLVVFPEMTLTGFTMDSNRIKENSSSSDTVRFFKDCAKKYNVCIAFGIVLEKQDKATNNLIIIDENGEVIANYAKMHPFSYANEDVYYIGGNEFITTQIADEQVGLSICYDLRFAEMYQVLSKQCKIILNIANWPQARVGQWNTLLKARAIENQVFMVAVNRIGKDGNGLGYEKSSQIISPYGKVLQGKIISEEVDIYDIDISEVDEYRKSFPVKNDRKIDLYKENL